LLPRNVIFEDYNCTKFDSSWDSAPDPTGKAHRTPQTPQPKFNGPASKERKKEKERKGKKRKRKERKRKEKRKRKSIGKKGKMLKGSKAPSIHISVYTAVSSKL